MEIWLVFALTGLAAGFMAGLLGIGGGFVVVPLLLLVLPHVGIPLAEAGYFAIGTSLACICVTALSSAYSHHRRDAIAWQLWQPLTPGLILGSMLGTYFAALLAGPVLVVLFVLGALITAAYLLSGHRAQNANSPNSPWMLFAYAQFTGAISALIGIGGGSVLVPFLVYRGVTMVKAVATAAACGFPIALVATIGYIYAGWHESQPIQFAVGYVYLPAWLGITLFSSLAAPLGAKLAHHIQEIWLKRVFALFLIFTSAQIIYSQWFSAA